MVLPFSATTARNAKRRKAPLLLRLCCRSRCCSCCSVGKRGGRGGDRRENKLPEKRQIFSNSAVNTFSKSNKGIKFTTQTATIVYIIVASLSSLGLFYYCVYHQVNNTIAGRHYQQQQFGPNVTTFDFFQNKRHHHAPPQFVIFYNIFIPNDQTGIQHAINIVKEQINQVKKSAAVVSIEEKKETKTILYYNTIGQYLPKTLEESRMQRDICGLQLICRHIKHYEQGTEAVTLQNLYDYCHQVDSLNETATTKQQQKHLDDNEDDDIRVIYLHSKGSYHKNAINDQWRQYLTMAATHHDCLHPISSSSSTTTNNNNNTNENVSCDVCGFAFFTEWTLFYPGNMWSARCNYIRQLLPPNQFEHAMERTIGNVLYMRLMSSHEGNNGNSSGGSIIQMQVFPDDRIDRYGLDRYATEHWIGSHPNLRRPCDVAPIEIPYRQYFSKKSSSKIDMEQLLHGALAPRSKGAPADNISSNITLFWEQQQQNKLGDNGKGNKNMARIREYFYLAGHVLKWQYLYNQTPPMDSYVWDWFPDGAAWKRAVQDYGPLAAVQVMTTTASDEPDNSSNNVTPKPPQQQPAALFVARRASSSLNVFATTRSLSSLAIFFQIDRRWMWNLHMNITEQLQVLIESVEIIASSKLVDTASIVLYYQILESKSPSERVNADEAQMISRLCSETRVLDCFELPSHSGEYEGETMQHLHDYCMMAAHNGDDDNPKRVVYLHNNFQGDDNDRYSRLWTTAARAAMGITCLQSIGNQEANNDSRCDLCGNQFEMMPEFHMAGNMWMASCSFIQRLVSPQDYVTLRQQVAKRAMVLKIKNRLTMNFFHGQVTRETLGIDKYALPYWVASHPMVEPCDVASSSSLGSTTTDHGKGSWFWTTPEQRLSLKNVASKSKLHLPRRSWQQESSSNYNATLDTMIRNDKSLRMREWCFFAGHVLRWGTIYNETPSPPSDTSWIWKQQQGLLPDTQEWLAAIHQYGYFGAIDFMTRPFANTKV